MKSSLAHLPEQKQRELERIVDILHAEFEDALAESSADWKKSGRILKIILFGSYARGDWVDEPRTMKGYRSDYDLLVVVNNNKLADFDFWYKAKDRLVRDKVVATPTSFIVHSRRFVNAAIRDGHYFFTDIRRQGIILYELDNEALAAPALLTRTATLSAASDNFDNRFSAARRSLETFKLQLEKSKFDPQWRKDAAFTLHQALEHTYATVLLVLTNYSPPSHKLNFLRALAESQDRRLTLAWPRDQQRHRAWFNTLNEAYVKARYSKHYEIGEEALAWLGHNTEELQKIVETLCNAYLAKLRGSNE